MRAALAALLLTAACVQGLPGLPGAAPAVAPAPAPLTLGLRLLKHNQPALALNAFNRSLAEDGVSVAALTGVGVSMMRLNRRREAKRFLTSAIGLDPYAAPARNALGVALYDEGLYAAAISEFKRAYALTDGADGAIATNLGIAEIALATEQAAAPDLDDFQFDVIQYGHGVYRLEPRETPSPAAPPSPPAESEP